MCFWVNYGDRNLRQPSHKSKKLGNEHQRLVHEYQRLSREYQRLVQPTGNTDEFMSILIRSILVQ
ncbi:MAG: hypothetical protein V7L31_22965 [Nostoc sp.]